MNDKHTLRAYLLAMVSAFVWLVGLIISLGCLFLFLEGCAHPGLMKKPYVRVQTGFDIIGVTPSKCLTTEQELSDASLFMAEVLKEVAARGLFEYPWTLSKAVSGTPLTVCVLEEPEQCGFVGPCRDVSRTCARKAGCAFSGLDTIWVARKWPPVCKASWPDEPHCILDTRQQTTQHFRNTLLHEIVNYVATRFGGVYKPNYQGADQWYGQNGVEMTVAKRTNALP